LSLDQCKTLRAVFICSVGIFKLLLVLSACAIFVPKNVADDTRADITAPTAKDWLGGSRGVNLASSTPGRETTEEAFF